MAWQAYAAMAGFQIASGLHQAETIRMNARIQDQINEMNARYAELDAYNVEIAGESEIAAYQPMISQTIGEQRVNMAAQDIDVTFGTAADIQEETRLTGYMNTLKMRQAARAKAMGLKMEASNMRLGGQMSRLQSETAARGAIASGIISAAGTGLNAYSRYGGGSGAKSTGTAGGGSSGGGGTPYYDISGIE